MSKGNCPPLVHAVERGLSVGASGMTCCLAYGIRRRGVLWWCLSGRIGLITGSSGLANRVILSLALALIVLAWPLAGEPEAQDPGSLLLDVAKRPVPAHNFKSIRLDGSMVQLADYRGKVVFLNFWATWCVPCVEEMPAMERLAQHLKDKPFVVLAVNMMEPLPVVKKFVAKLKLTYDIVMDESGDIGGNYAANRLPLTYIIDKQGNIISRAVGARIWDNKDSIAYFQKLVAE